MLNRWGPKSCRWGPGGGIGSRPDAVHDGRSVIGNSAFILANRVKNGVRFNSTRVANRGEYECAGRLLVLGWDPSTVVECKADRVWIEPAGRRLATT